MNVQNSICINIQVESPYLTKDKFCEVSGMSKNTLNGYLMKGLIPTKAKNKKNELVLIDIVGMLVESARSNNINIMIGSKPKNTEITTA